MEAMNPTEFLMLCAILIFIGFVWIEVGDIKKMLKDEAGRGRPKP